MQHILDKLLICLGQYKMFGEQQYSIQFDFWLKELQRVTKTTPEGALDILVNWINGEEVAA